MWTACEEVHHVPDDDTIEEEAAAESQPVEFSGDIAPAAAASECVSENINTAEPSHVNSQQDNTSRESAVMR